MRPAAEAGFGQHQAVVAAFLTPVREDEQMLLLGGFWCPSACGVCDLWHALWQVLAAATQPYQCCPNLAAESDPLLRGCEEAA